MSRPATQGFQKPIDTGKRKRVRIAVISYGQTEDGRGYAQCSCGAPFTQPREKVREDAIDRHINRRHGGQGIRL
jgi:hypothetical protein